MADVETIFYTKTRDAWDCMLQDIDRAQKTIDIEQYIFTVDVIGTKFLELLQEKARVGVKIRLLCDTVGSWGFYNSPMPALLRKLGIEVRFFNPISPWRLRNFTSGFFRDHRKIMVIDHKIAHLGGVGIRDDMVDWRDTHMKITGLLVKDILNSFETMWVSMEQTILVRFRRSPQYIKSYNLLTNSPRPGQRYIYYAMVWAIRNAKKCIYLTSPYFVPDIRMFRVLRLAAKKGIDVRLLVPEVSDSAFVDYGQHSYFSMAMKAGIKIYMYKGSMMHAKTAIIDEEWATAGSFNLDNLSASFNSEVNIAAFDAEFIGELKKHFFEDLQQCKQLDYEKWRQRPFKNKILEFLTWPFHGVM